MFRFVHSSDLHLGKPFGRFPEDVRVRLRQARAEALPRLAALARDQGASHVLLAGDTFDQTTPAPAVIRQAMNAMRAAEGIIWVILPGNHDHANATELWRQVAQDAPPNVVLALDASPMALAPGVALLPAPPTERHPGRDLTAWFDAAGTGDDLRIGLAHGSVTSFSSSEDGGSSVIAPDRAARAGLGYLALGDWHGQVQVGPATWYSGAPEADGFKHAARPSALVVAFAGPRAPAVVTSHPTAALVWHSAVLDVQGDADVVAAHAACLPALAQRAQTLLALSVRGRATLRDRAALEQAIAAAAPDFLWHQADLTALTGVHDSQDLDLLDRQGALRAAAEALAAEAADPNLPEDKRATAQAALSYLFGYALETT